MNPKATKSPLSGMYVATITAAGAAVLAIAASRVLAADYGRELLAWAGITVVAAFLGELSTRLPIRDCRLSFSDGLIFLATLLFGVDLATLTAAADGYASSTRRRGSWHKRLFNTASMALSVNLSARLFQAMLPSPLGPGAARIRFLDFVAPLLVMVGVQYLLNTAFVSLAVGLSGGVPVLTVWQRSFGWNGFALMAGAGAAAVVFLVIHAVGAASFVAIVPVPFLLYHSYRFFLHRFVPKKALAGRI